MILEVIFPDQLRYYRNLYQVFGNTSVASVKFLWDTIYYWRVYAHKFMTGTFADLNKLSNYISQARSISFLNKEAQSTFRDWAEKSNYDAPYKHVDLAAKHVFIESAVNLLTKPNRNGIEVQPFLEDMLSSIKQAYEEDISTGLQLGSPASKNVSFSTYRQFFGIQTKQEMRKWKWVRIVASVGRGKMLYAVRDQFVSRMVAGRTKAHGFGLLRRFYPH